MLTGSSDLELTFDKTQQTVGLRFGTVGIPDGATVTAASWLTVGARSFDQRTPDLASVVQEIVDLPGWSPGNPINFVISGSGERVADSYEGGASNAPILHVEYLP